MHRILEKQNSNSQLVLIKAASVAYTRAKLFEVVFLRLMFFLAMGALIVYLIFPTTKSKLILGCCAFVFSIFIQLLFVFIHGNVNRGAMFKEKFDVLLFGLPWKATLSHPDVAEAERYANSYHGRPLSNWYPTEFADNLPDAVIIASCQRINAAWDVWVRQSFCKFLYTVLAVYTFLLFMAFIYFNLDGLSILPLLFSNLSFYLYFINQLRGHRSVIDTRKNISSILDKYILEERKEPTMLLLREVQDEILATRKISVLVPNFYFMLTHKQRERDINSFVDEVNRVWSKPE